MLLLIYSEELWDLSLKSVSFPNRGKPEGEDPSSVVVVGGGGGATMAESHKVVAVREKHHNVEVRAAPALVSR